MQRPRTLAEPVPPDSRSLTLRVELNLVVFDRESQATLAAALQRLNQFRTCEHYWNPISVGKASVVR